MGGKYLCVLCASLGILSIVFGSVFSCEGTPELRKFLWGCGAVLLFYSICKGLHFKLYGNYNLSGWEYFFIFFEWAFAIFGAYMYSKQSDLYAQIYFVDNKMRSILSILNPAPNSTILVSYDSGTQNCNLLLSRLALFFVIIGFLHLIVNLHNLYVWARQVFEVASQNLANNTVQASLNPIPQPPIQAVQAPTIQTNAVQTNASAPPLPPRPAVSV